MYKVTYVHKNETEERSLYIPGDHDYCLISAKLDVGLGISGEFNLQIPDVNLAKAEIECLTDEIIVYRDEKEIWRGRPVTVQIDFDLTGHLTCEGILSYLYDTYYPPFEFEGSPNDLLKSVIDNHNSMVEERKQFQIGEITVVDPNDYINRSSIYYNRTITILQEKFIQDSLGGYFRVRVENGIRYLDYLEAYNTESSQPVRYGYNILDIAQDVEYSDVASAILPLGAKLLDENGMETDERLTIASVNNGDIYIKDDQAVQTYGWIAVEAEWDDVTLPENLYTKGEDYLKQVTSPISRFTVKAIDLSLADPEIDPINLGDFVLIRVDAFGMNQMVELTGMEIDLLDPVNSVLEFGTDAATLTGATTNTQRSIQESLGSIDARFTNLTTNVLNAVYANIEEIVAGTITVDFIRAAVADMGYVTADWVEANTISVQDLEAVYADIQTLYADLANIHILFADYATIENLTALEAYIADAYVSNAVISDLLAGYAKIVDLEAVSADIGLLTADVADIVSLLAGEAGVGILDAIHLTTDNAVIDEAVITEALIGTVLADIIQSNVIITDYITIMSEDGGITISGNQVINTNGQWLFYDSDGNVRMQIGQDASGSFSFILYDETGTGIMLDSEGIHASAIPDGLIVDAMVANDANIAASKLDIEDLTRTLNENGQLTLTAEQITIGGGTLDYELTQITQQISDLESEGIQRVENYYAITTNPDWYPPHDGDESQTSILGEMILGEAILGYGGEDDWTTERLVAGKGEYLWYCQKLTYADGHIEWTTATLITDDYIHNLLSIQQTELEVVQGQITAKIWQSDIDTAVNSLNDEIGVIAEQYALIDLTINEIDERVGTLTTTVDEYYTELSSQVTSLTLNLDGITAEVREVNEKTANAITDGVPYYATSTNPNWYPPHESSGSDTSILGEMILGEAILGFGGDDWSEDQPAAEEDQYVWISYLRTRVDGSTYWTEPTLLTDEWGRLSYAEMSEKYSQLVLTIDSALLEVYSAISTVEGNVTELNASIREYVDETSAGILSTVAGLYVTSTEFVSATATLEQYINDETASIRSDLSFYATTDSVTTQIVNATNEINQVIEGLENSISITVSDIYTDFGDLSEAINAVEQATGKAVAGATQYYILSPSRTECTDPNHEDDDTSTNAIYGEALFGQAIYGKDTWSTEPKTADDFTYVWSSYLITTIDGETYWSDPTLSAENFITTWEAEASINTAVSEGLASINLTVTGTLGGTASIIMTSDAGTIENSLNLSNVRQAFADDKSAIVISAGTVMFESNTLLISSSQFTLDKSGNATFSGNLSAPSGNIGGWTIATTALYNGTSSMTSTTAGTYIGTNGIRQYASESAYTNIQNGIITAYGAKIYGEVTAVEGDYMTVIKGGEAGFYLNSTEYGAIFAQSYSTDDTNDNGVTIQVASSASFVRIARSTGGTIDKRYPGAYSYVANFYGKYGGYSEINLFNGDARFLNNVYVDGSIGLRASGIHCDGTITSEGGIYFPVSSSLGTFFYFLGVSSEDVCQVGNSSYDTSIRGKTITSSKEIVVSSDSSVKHSIEEVSDKYITMLDSIEPIRFIYNDVTEDEHGRVTNILGSDKTYHIGYRAEDVLEAAEEAGLSENDVGFYCADACYGYAGIAYGELIPLLHLKIKQLESRIEQLEAQAS